MLFLRVVIEKLRQGQSILTCSRSKLQLQTSARAHSPPSTSNGLIHAMRSFARCNQHRLPLVSTRSPRLATQCLPSCSKYLRRRLATKSTRNARDEPPAPSAEERTSDRVKIKRYKPRNEVKRQAADESGPVSDITFRSLDLKLFNSDSPLPVRKRPANDRDASSAKNVVKDAYSEGLPYDPAETIPGMARYVSKRNTEAATERFLGVRRDTKHEMVNKALEHARAIHRQRKGQQGLDAWANDFASESEISTDLSETIGTRESFDGNSMPESKLNKPATQSEDVMAQQFDILGDIGSKFQTAESNNESSQSPSEEAPNLQFDAENASYVDWDNLPLSPLMHQRLIDARQRFHGFKRSPHEVTDYDVAKGAQFLHDYIGCMLASPIRACRLTNARLPKDFLLTMQALQHPETRQVWELPKRLNPQNTSVEMSSEAFGKEESPDKQTTSEEEVHSSSTPPSNSVQDGAEGSRAITMSTTPEYTVSVKKEDSSDDIVHNNIGSYMISTQAAIQWMSALKRKVYLRTIPPRWRQKLGNALVNEIHWRPDMPFFILSLMQRQIIDQLRILKPASDDLEDRTMQRQNINQLRMKSSSDDSEDETIEPCVSVDENGRLKIKDFAKLTERVILYLGYPEQSNTRALSFASTVKAMAKGQTTKAVVRNDLINDSRDSGSYPPIVRIQAENSANTIVYDLTRLLNSKFIHALRSAGYGQIAYYVKDTEESTRLRTRLWWLAHYVE